MNEPPARAGLATPTICKGTIQMTPRQRIEAQDRLYHQHRNLPFIGLLTIILIVAAVCLTVGLTLGWLVWGSDPQAMIDFVAPTAAQAREQGWVNISERL